MPRLTIKGLPKRRNVRRGTNGNNKSVALVVKRVLDSRQEHKIFTTNAAGAATVAGNMYTISQGLVTGDGINARDGDVIMPTKLRFKFQAITTGVGVPPVPDGAMYRVILFQDNMNVGVAPLVADLLTASLPYAQFDPENSQQSRFRILFDRMLPLSNYGDNCSHAIQYDIPMRGKINYNGVANAVASNGKGSIWLFTCINSVAKLTLAEAYEIQLVFTDS